MLSQKTELEWNLFQADFLKDYKENKAFKQAFQFRRWLQASNNTLRTDLVPFLNLSHGSEVFEVISTLDGCRVVVASADYDCTMIIGWSQD